VLKPVFNGDRRGAKAEARACAAYVLDQIGLQAAASLHAVHHEELWQKTAGERGRDTMLVNAAWPVYEGLGDADAAAEMEWVIRLITEIRSVRSEMNVPAGAKIAWPCLKARRRS
jgi:valyl-tRNA synthetase